MRAPESNAARRRIALRIILLLYADDPQPRAIRIRHALDTEHHEHNMPLFMTVSNGNFLEAFKAVAEELIAAGLIIGSYSGTNKSIENACLTESTSSKLDAVKGSEEFYVELRDPCDISAMPGQPTDLAVCRLANVLGFEP